MPYCHALLPLVLAAYFANIDCDEKYFFFDKVETDVGFFSQLSVTFICLSGL